MDWKDYGVDSILSKTVENRKLGNGSIILQHVGAKYTPEALEKIVVGLQEKGYMIVPVSQLIYTGVYKLDQMGRQIEK
jgi:peptidoglycan/xylan/chitin deacetylase (PgdA/CDA1 family)